MQQLNRRIIVFDDEQDILSICEMVLEDAGWEVFTFNTCTDIVAKVTKIDPSIILIDQRIPDVGGVASTQLLKRTDSLKHILVILFSATDKISVLADEAGADTYLAKPFEILDLEKIVEVYAKSSIA